MKWETIIGIETHAQLSTISKIFSNASTKYNTNPNSNISAIDIALPGTLPRLNYKSVEYAIKFGLAINSKISICSIFERKNYFYPDLPKGYQISQNKNPIIVGGHIKIQIPENKKTGKSSYEKIVNLSHAHLEEDSGKLLHKNFKNMSGIDFNRAGMPLIEIVTKPEISNEIEAVEYAKALHELLVWIDICDGNMEKGSFRCDVNISVKPTKQLYLNNRVEIKNLNSFSFISEAIKYENLRQINTIKNGNIVLQETRLYDPNKKETRLMRYKENIQDYRYFPDPDLMPIIIKKEWIHEIQNKIPELPYNARKRIIKEYNLSLYESIFLTSQKEILKYFEIVVKKIGIMHSKLAINWIMGEISHELNRKKITINQISVNPDQLSILLKRIIDKTISNKIAKNIFFKICKSVIKEENIIDKIIKENNLYLKLDEFNLEYKINKIINQNKKLVLEFQLGKTKVLNSLIGKIMKETSGKANPQNIKDILEKKLLI